jgi:hypothetical protein
MIWRSFPELHHFRAATTRSSPYWNSERHKVHRELQLLRAHEAW